MIVQLKLLLHFDYKNTNFSMLTENQHNIFKETVKNIFKNFFLGLNVRILDHDELEVQKVRYKKTKNKFPN